MVERHGWDAAARAHHADQANYALLVDAKDDAAAAFYRHHGFTPYASNPRILFLPLATATVLQYLYPTLSALAGWRWLGERIGRRLMLAIPLGWLGVLLVCAPGGAAPSLLGVVLALAGAGLTALAYISVRELGRTEPALVIMLYFPLTSLPLCLPFVALDPVLPHGTEWLWLIGVGLFTQLGQMGLTWGLVRLPVAPATALGYAQVPFAALWGWLWFGEALAPATAIGAALVLGSTLLSLPARPAGGR